MARRGSVPARISAARRGRYSGVTSVGGAYGPLLSAPLPPEDAPVAVGVVAPPAFSEHRIREMEGYIFGLKMQYVRQVVMAPVEEMVRKIIKPEGGQDDGIDFVASLPFAWMDAFPF